MCRNDEWCKNALMQVCYDGQLLMSGHRAQPLLSLRHTYLPEKVLQRLQNSLLFRWPLLDAAELADGYNAISIDVNMQGEYSIHVPSDGVQFASVQPALCACSSVMCAC